MSRAVSDIAQRLSLRAPQRDALERLASLVERRGGERPILPLVRRTAQSPGESTPPPAEAPDLTAVEGRVAAVASGFSSFERDFPSLCFALATGVGKTRLMGAFMAYLFREHGVRHFFVLAPNLTIYQKLKADFSPGSGKYVLAGLSEFATHPPKLIHGENYETSQLHRYRAERGLFDEAHINVFNISKFNRDATEGKSGQARMRRLSETLGESYFDYLRSLPDLVLMMDESHRYRGDAGVKALNELRPLLGLELTATPHVELGKKTEPFKNVVYAYGLYEAMRDGFVKEPAVVTRKDFDAKAYKDREDALEAVKLEDAVRVHEEVKGKLSAYAERTRRPRVKPFILVIAKDTEHATKLTAHLQSNDFFYGKYDGKVIEVHSGTKGEEKDEIVQKLLSVEDPKNPVEIVVHVNMLKEGWDVRNLYTIVPLRKADSKTLIEQSVGRGLRLPYGERTGDPELDRLCIIAHDNFSALLDEAKDPKSAVAKYFQPQVVVIDPTTPVVTYVQGTTTVRVLTDTALAKPPSFEVNGDVRSSVDAVVHSLFAEASPEAEPDATVAKACSQGDHRSLVETITCRLPSATAALPGFEAYVDHVAKVVEKAYRASVIEIPAVHVAPSLEAESYFEPFDLDRSRLPSYLPVEQTILVRALRDQNLRSELGVRENYAEQARLEDYVLRVLDSRPEVDYQRNSALLQKLATQLVEHVRADQRGDEDATANVVRYYQRELGDAVYAQLEPHFHHVPARYEVTVGKRYELPRSETLAMPAGTVPVDIRALVQEKSKIRQMVFEGFTKGVTSPLKLDSDSERRFVLVMEDDPEVLKWWRTRREVLHLRYGDDQVYIPDFLVETTKAKWIVEVKREDEVDKPDVVEKKRAALEYCEHATKFELENNGKPWRYMLVPHDVIDPSKSFEGLAKKYG